MGFFFHHLRGETKKVIIRLPLGSFRRFQLKSMNYSGEDIRAWFEQHDETLYSKRNKGIWLDLPDSKRLLLKNEIIDVDRFETYPD